MVLLTAIMSARVLPATAGNTDPVPSRYIVVDPVTGLAVGGYDPVAYFVDRRAREGKPRLEYEWSGVIWRFVNEGNLAAFQADPHIYMPRFGGHDARALATGLLAPGDPQVWAIYHERLYLFFSPARRFQWLTAPDRYIKEADEAWTRRVDYKIGDGFGGDSAR